MPTLDKKVWDNFADQAVGRAWDSGLRRDVKQALEQRRQSARFRRDVLYKPEDIDASWQQLEQARKASEAEKEKADEIVEKHAY